MSNSKRWKDVPVVPDPSMTRPPERVDPELLNQAEREAQAKMSQGIEVRQEDTPAPDKAKKWILGGIVALLAFSAVVLIGALLLVGAAAALN